LPSGYEWDPNSIGDASNEMGNNLPLIQLGTGLEVDKIYTGFIHSCILFTIKKIKCFGNNRRGQLGNHLLPNPTGTLISHMSDSLPFVDLGTNKSNSYFIINFFICKPYMCNIIIFIVEMFWI